MEFQVVRNDITNMQVEAVVCPANTYLIEGAGAARAIFLRAGEQELQKACKKIAPCPEGGAKVTSAFNLDARFIIHAVAAKWIDGMHDEYAILSAAYISSLELADKMKCRSIAFPLLASGYNGFDKEFAFEVARRSIHEYQPTECLEEVYLVVYDDKTMKMLDKLKVPCTEVIDSEYAENNKWDYCSGKEINKAKRKDQVEQVRKKAKETIGNIPKAVMKEIPKAAEEIPKTISTLMDKFNQLDIDKVTKTIEQGRKIYEWVKDNFGDLEEKG